MNPVTPAYGGFRWRPKNQKSDPLPCSLWLNHTNICSTGRDSVIQNFFFFWTDLPPSNRFDFLWSCHFCLAYHHWKEAKKSQHVSISSLNKHFKSASFLFKNLTIILSVFPSLWQATIRDLSRLIPICCKRHSMKFSRSFGATELEMPEKSKHSLLVYSSSLCCCLWSFTSSLLVVLKASHKIFEAFFATETWLVNSSFFFASESILYVISNSFFDMSLFYCNKSFCWSIILSCNAKKDAIKFSLLIFSNCTLVRICNAMINWKLPML